MTLILIFRWKKLPLQRNQISFSTLTVWLPLLSLISFVTLAVLHERKLRNTLTWDLSTDYLFLDVVLDSSVTSWIKRDSSKDCTVIPGTTFLTSYLSNTTTKWIVFIHIHTNLFLSRYSVVLLEEFWMRVSVSIFSQLLFSVTHKNIVVILSR